MQLKLVQHYKSMQQEMVRHLSLSHFPCVKAMHNQAMITNQRRTEFSGLLVPITHKQPVGSIVHSVDKPFPKPVRQPSVLTTLFGSSPLAGAGAIDRRCCSTALHSWLNRHDPVFSNTPGYDFVA